MTRGFINDIDRRHINATDDLIVAVAIPNQVVQLGLTSMLLSIPSISDLLTFDTVDELMHDLGGRDIDVVVLPCPSDDCSSVSLATQAATAQGTKVLVLLDTSDQQDVSKAANLRADGFLIQTELTRERLHEALHRITSGEMSIPSTLARELLSNVRRRRSEKPGRAVLLTPREHQALLLLADGLSNKQIARRLGISEHGAKRHVANVLAKLNSPNRTLAVAIALKEGLLAERTDRQ
ncbi:response regulator transcription factor [Micromonospora sp. WMMA1947]|uniref:LuxR C-terminal-related transcriptional regulator n=1 Tax=Micromonospora sp. WMMA1947 TaxID=3015163 RepID=UPI00248C1BC9|nr:response regulator transcription factor [Micromonospora sp. WMMA1947]WBC07462.1 response regulator transcription factor [Micromonospora sp. WMMA1947]